MNDPQIRAVLYPWLRARYPTSQLVGEFGRLRQAVADVAAFAPGHFHCYEIKSDHDSLRRLPGQVLTYATFFHHLTIVVGPRHLAHVLADTPAWVGVVLVTEAGQLREQRAAGNNPVAPLTAQALWLEESRELCRRHGLRGFSRLTTWSLPGFLHAQLPAAVIEEYVLQCLRQRYPRPFGTAAKGE